MQQIDRKSFFDGYRAAFGPLEQGQVDGLEFLLASLEADEQVVDLRWGAYILATTKHETADTFRPVKEYGRGEGRPYGRPAENGLVYYGRGYVQLTWDYNYKRMGELLGIPLYDNPDLACDPSTAYKIMSLGMRKGLFTGKRLAYYISGDSCNYQLARKIINGSDKAKLIAGYAEKFEKILRKAA